MISNLEQLEQSGNIIFSCITGSRAYNLNNPNSDTDIRGIFRLPKSDTVSVFEPSKEIGNEKQDIKYYELKKFITLAAQCNPNIIELLFMPKITVRTMTPIMEHLIKNRDMFMTTRAEVTFSGYAFAQLEKAKGQNKLVHNPQPKERPTKEQFCKIIFLTSLITFAAKIALDPTYIRELIDAKMFPCRPCPLPADFNLAKYHVAALENVSNTYRLYKYGDDAKGVFRNEMLVCENIPMEDEWAKFAGLLIYNQHEYEKAIRDWKNYWEWVENRNEERWKLQESGKLDYDTKNFMHLFRLLRSGANILKNGEPIIRFEGKERDFLMDIRNGKFAYDYLYKLAQDEFAQLKEIKQVSKLPYDVDMHKIDRLYKECYDLFV